MARIYQRNGLISDVKVKKKGDCKRTRSAILNFRMLPEEKALIENRIALSGLSKQDFFTQSCLHQKIVTFGNVKTYEAIKKRLEEIDEHLMNVQKADELDLEVLESLRTILEILDGIGKEE